MPRIAACAVLLVAVACGGVRPGEPRLVDLTHAVGLDTPSIDHGPSRSFESHRALFAAQVPAFENVANLERLPARGFRIVALPMKIRGGSGGPLRIIAIVEP